MDKLKLTGRNLGQAFNSRLSRACIVHAIVHLRKQPNLKLKTWPKQLLGSLPLPFALPSITNAFSIVGNIVQHCHGFVSLWYGLVTFLIVAILRQPLMPN
jgi:hypothetical protein